MNGPNRPRPPPPADPRRGGDPRNGASDSMSRAEKFEDEKKRIIQSCYSKKDTDGTLNESYITHVRITEDGTHPSTPAPPNVAPENKKPRVIIVSVRKSGRVRMHKARENNDGSFSIGKTWMLDDLSSIQSYTAFVPRTPVEQQHKEWAGTLGFLVTVGKPYYWHARSAKEKEFFIGSLVKIYKKYTGGKVPNLIGFDERERQALVGTASSGSPVPPPSRSGPAPPPDVAPPAQPPSSYGSRDPSRDGSREIRRKPSEEPTLRSQKSREQMSRPSTGSRPPAPSPFGPQNPPPSIPPPQRAEPKTFFDTDESRPSMQDEARPSSSRSGQPSTLAAQPVEAKHLDSQPSADALRPTTPVSLAGDSQGAGPSPVQYKPYREPVDKTPAMEKPPQPPLEQNAPQDVSPMVLADEPKEPPLPETEAAPAPPLVDPAVAAEAMAAYDTSAPATESAVETPKEPASATPSDKTQEGEESHRPGLGPMIKKKSAKDIAGAFRKAANLHGAFKPRPGGAGERLLAAAKKQQGQAQGPEPDGITGVVPAPFLSRTDSDTPKSPVGDTTEKGLPASTPPAPLPPTPAAVEQPRKVETPTVEVTDHATEEAAALPLPSEGSKDSLTEVGRVETRSRTPSPAAQGRRRRRREDHTLKYCQILGIDATVLDGRGIDFDEILTDLGWNGRLSDEQKIEDLEADVRREIGRVEATSWLGNLEQQEGKVEQLAVLIDKTIEECEELDGLLTLYSHELNTLNEDVSYIEAQSQGLQVQTANQKLLQSELQNLLKTLSISSTEMRPLKEATLSNMDGLKSTENALSTLYKAMLMIDADIGQNKQRQADASVGVYANTEIGQMRAIKQKKEEYRSTALAFLQRLKQFMSLAFKLAEQKRTESMSSVSKDPQKLDNAARQAGRGEIWMFNPLMLFAREVSTSDWHSLLHQYEQQSKSSYQNEFRDNNLAWKRQARKPTGDEQELLFTHQEKEKEGEGITMAARKLTVRRGKTVRAAAGHRQGSGEKTVAKGKIEPCEAFAGSLRETLNMITEEQNFVVQFFHLDSLATTEYSDLIASHPPEQRLCPDFSAKQSHDPDRAMAKRVEGVMDELYSFWPNDIQSMVDWALQADPMQGIGILFAIETAMADLDDTNQEFIIHSLQKMHSRLMGLFNRFVDDQIRGVEDTKVKINKRKGVISFMRVFPHFSTAVENMLSQPSGDFCDIRVSVNDAYERINRAMWESLKFIAKEAPGQPPGVSASAGDPEDKEILNHHILLIENMNHYAEEVDVHNLPVLQRWVDKAHQDFAEHMKLYLDAVIHRPLGKLIDFISSIETIQANGSTADVASRTSHSRAVAKKVLSSYDSKEIKRGIEMLKKRVEKHFGDADDPGLSRSLVIKVLRECEGRYEDAWDRTRRIIDTVYEGQLELEWRKEDSAAMFRK
ncbi:hypothetical protein N7509_003356 [Penicillium cosmopolitanum]|uniref:Exocyst complex component Sec3 PIP2-binding N-terminal domain-containing protein n=1 Tax=Penicillium cosmopolitanum TaxID=1131564 RepID=A0A9W9W4V5_9EURO|nr:uncharacterized protein N7509_003356 [Penicillium cosmopolitanum]KAJ5403485.1 hypothetical protein N7509_003356 [Penicillium cosmopolitanum]